jgi:hypothetical protein
LYLLTKPKKELVLIYIRKSNVTNIQIDPKRASGVAAIKGMFGRKSKYGHSELGGAFPLNLNSFNY